MNKTQIADCLKTMSREELRNVATHLNVPRGKNKLNTVWNLTDAFADGKARFKIEFTIKTNPPAGQKYGGTVLHRGKVRTYGIAKTLWAANPPAKPQPLAAAA